MFKLVVVFAVAVACVSAAPGAVLAGYAAAPLAAPAFVTASSSQVIARNYNGLAAPLVAAAAPVAVAAPLKAAPVVAAPFRAAPLAYAGPVAAPLAATPLAAGPVAAPLAAAPYLASAPAYYF